MKYRIYITLSLVALLVLPACQERLDEMNTNPNAITSVPADYLFTTAVRKTFRLGDAGTYKHSSFDLLQVDFGAQHAHLAVSNDFRREIDKYNELCGGDYTLDLFKDIYFVIRYCKDILSLTEINGSQENEIQHALAEVVSIMNFARLTDLFGDIPYSEGGLGKEGVFLPEYDKQEDIYSHMVEQLGNILVLIKEADFSQAFPGADPIYDNNPESWIRFTNSLRLRLAMRARFADPEKYEPIIAECLTEDLIEENTHNASLQHWDSDYGSMRNPWYKRYEERYVSNVNYFNVSQHYVDFLTGTADPRLAVMVSPNKNGNYIGMPNGLADILYGNFDRANACILSDQILAKDQYLYFMTASEIWLLRSEAALFSLGPGDANLQYRTGITRAMEQWGVEQSEIEDFLDNSPAGSLTGSDEEKFEQIGYQMWVAFVPNYIQAWFNMRRTGYPSIPQRTSDSLVPGVTNGYMPSRLIYPTNTENTINGENMQVAIDRLENGDHIYSRVWWDVKD